MVKSSGRGASKKGKSLVGRKGAQKSSRSSPRRKSAGVTGIEADDADRDSISSSHSLAHPLEHGDSAASDVTEEGGMSTMEREEAVASFFEGRPHFYDKSNESYKNKQRKEAELEEFAKTIGWTG